MTYTITNSKNAEVEKQSKTSSGPLRWWHWQVIFFIMTLYLTNITGFLHTNCSRWLCYSISCVSFLYFGGGKSQKSKQLQMCSESHWPAEAEACLDLACVWFSCLCSPCFFHFPPGGLPAAWVLASEPNRAVSGICRAGQITDRSMLWKQTSFPHL